MARTLDPKDFQERLGKIFENAESHRKDALARLAENEDREAANLERIRKKLVGEVGDEADPRVRALDRRLAGAKRFAGTVRKAAEETPSKPEAPSDWVVTGQVQDASGKPVDGALITLESDDQELVRLFGETRTGKDGRFEIRHAAKDFEPIFKRGSKARIVVTSPDGKLAQTTGEVQPAGGQTHNFDVSLRPEKPSRGAKKESAKP